MRPLRLIVDFLTYEGTPPTNNPRDLTESIRKVEESNVSQTLRAQQTVPAAAVDQVIPLSAASNDYLAIYVDQTVSIKLNADSTPIVLNPQLAGKMCPVFVLRGVITSLTMSNAGATAANVDIRSVKI